MRLIPEARKWYRMFSVQALIAIGALQGVLAILTEAQKALPIPLMGDFTWGALGTAATVAVAVIGAIGRVVDQGMQPSVEPPPPQTMFADSIPGDTL